MPYSTASHSFIFVSDTHVGNHFGICSRVPELGEDEPNYLANDLQSKLFNGFQKCMDRIKQPKKIQALFLGGDLVDGPNMKRPGKDLWTNDPIVAVYDFNKLLWPLASKATQVLGIRGSDYHVNPDRTTINYDELACQMIGANPYRTGIYNVDRIALANKVKELRAKGKKRSEIDLKQIEKDLDKEETYLAKKLRLNKNIFNKEQESLKQNQPLPYPLTDVRFKGIFNNTAIVVKHHVSYSPNYMYRSTGLIRNDMIQTLQEKRHFPNGYTNIIYAYGHAHYFHQSGNETHHNFVIPCWKANDTYLKQYGITEPDYGIVEVIVEPNDEVIILPYTLRGPDYPVTEPYNLARSS